MIDDPFRVPSILELNEFINMESIGITIAEFNEGFFTAAQTDMTATDTSCYEQTALVSDDIKWIFNIQTYSSGTFDVGKLLEKFSTLQVKQTE